ncbi:hypothetical protein GGR58DRAFT_482426 [Xylaria digitata]|nr:hypothetical protein GGR58DRAFT_482426 [Xylaria digitata]
MILFTAALVCLWAFIATSSYSVIVAICLQPLLAFYTGSGWWGFWSGWIAFGMSTYQWSIRQCFFPVIDVLAAFLFFKICVPSLDCQLRQDHFGTLISLLPRINLGRLNSWMRAYLTHIHPAFPLALYYLFTFLDKVIYSMIQAVKTGIYIISYHSVGQDYCCPDWRLREIARGDAARRERLRQSRPSPAVLRRQYEETSRRLSNGPQERWQRQPENGPQGGTGSFERGAAELKIKYEA